MKTFYRFKKRVSFMMPRFGFAGAICKDATGLTIK